MRKITSAYSHVLACVDGRKHSPIWLRRAHRFGHLIYFGTMTFGLREVHEWLIPIVFTVEVLAVFLGKDELRDAVIEFE